MLDKKNRDLPPQHSPENRCKQIKAKPDKTDNIFTENKNDQTDKILSVCYPVAAPRRILRKRQVCIPTSLCHDESIHTHTHTHTQTPIHTYIHLRARIRMGQRNMTKPPTLDRLDQRNMMNPPTLDKVEVPAKSRTSSP